MQDGSTKLSDDDFTVREDEIEYDKILSSIIERQSQIGLTALEFNLLVQVINLSKGGDPIYVRTIANRMGVVTRSVQRYTTALEKKGFLDRTPTNEDNGGQGGNIYTIGPSLAKLIDMPPIVTPSSKNRSLLQIALAHYGHGCARCGSTFMPTVDHIVPSSRGGSDRLENLQILCRTHNTEKGTRIVDYRSLNADTWLPLPSM